MLAVGTQGVLSRRACLVRDSLFTFNVTWPGGGSAAVAHQWRRSEPRSRPCRGCDSPLRPRRRAPHVIHAFFGDRVNGACFLMRELLLMPNLAQYYCFLSGKCGIDCSFVAFRLRHLQRIYKSKRNWKGYTICFTSKYGFSIADVYSVCDVFMFSSTT
jgi:hypothetical protein